MSTVIRTTKSAGSCSALELLMMIDDDLAIWLAHFEQVEMYEMCALIRDEIRRRKG
ncbi:hypothetical protein [Arcticibacter sp. MXS-1]|uniref:hypothetical protein n=1 Tax=Arcticibacter sp. MXS-1 TaxID=3341726 RepID=UPI0035A90FBF